MINIELLSKLFLNTNIGTLQKYLYPLQIKTHAYDITNKKRVAMFLAQCGHESGGFNFIEENLNYSAERLLAVFPKYFTAETVQSYHRNPKAIGSRVYANRMGNGDESSTDGWKYRGRGLIQLTGKYNYINFGKSINMQLDEVVGYLTTPDGAVESACWFWKNNNINSYADNGDIVGATKRINGGTNGVIDRTNIYKRALTLIQ